METVPSTGGGSNQAGMWAMLCHLSALAGFIIPFGSIVGPIVVWQLKKKEFPVVDDQGKESVNFQLTVFLAILVSMVLMFVGIGFLLIAAVGIGALVLTIIAAIKANQGILYRYPLKITWIK